MTAVDTDGTLYNAQESGNPGNAPAMVTEAAGTTFFTGKLTAVYSELLSATAGGTGDTVSFMRLPEGTVILGGWLYFEDGLGADDGDLADLGVVYEASDGTDDVDCLLDGIDIYDGQTSPLAQEALPAGSIIQLGSTTTAFPYKVTGGIGTVQLITLTDAIVTAKDMKLCLLSQGEDDGHIRSRYM
jgi:hypothetical protein